MKTQSRKILKLIVILLLTGITLSCNKNKDAEIYGCYFNWSKDTWIDNKQDALDSQLRFDNLELNKRNLDSLYKTKAHFLFLIGSGSTYTKAEECSAKITKDTISIYYKPMWSDDVGWLDYTYLCLEINKIKYPNYREMKIVFIPE